MTIKVVLPGIPRTKKTHPRVLPMISGEDLKKMVKDLTKAMSHKDAIGIIMRALNVRVQPSEKYVEWFDDLLLRRAEMQRALLDAGLKLPIEHPVSIAASVYREANTGDFTGYVEAIGDAIQASLWQCQACRKRQHQLSNCRECGASIAQMREARKGLGLILDDKQIVHWDGTRLKKDADNPRVEMYVRIYPPEQGALFA